MRPRERLIEVLASCNVDQRGGSICRYVGLALQGVLDVNQAFLRAYTNNPHILPHFAELLEEAVHYLKKDAPKPTNGWTDPDDEEEHP
jgi:hypothetical protein